MSLDYHMPNLVLDETDKKFFPYYMRRGEFLIRILENA